MHCNLYKLYAKFSLTAAIRTAYSSSKPIQIINRGGFRGGGRSPPLRDSTPCRPKGSLL